MINFVLNEQKLKKMSTTELKWFIDIAESGLKGSWKGHKLEATVRDTLKKLKLEYKKR